MNGGMIFPKIELDDFVEPGTQIHPAQREVIIDFTHSHWAVLYCWAGTCYAEQNIHRLGMYRYCGSQYQFWFGSNFLAVWLGPNPSIRTMTTQTNDNSNHKYSGGPERIQYDQNILCESQICARFNDNDPKFCVDYKLDSQNGSAFNFVKSGFWSRPDRPSQTDTRIHGQIRTQKPKFGSDHTQGSGEQESNDWERDQRINFTLFLGYGSNFLYLATIFLSYRCA